MAAATYILDTPGPTPATVRNVPLPKPAAPLVPRRPQTSPTSAPPSSRSTLTESVVHYDTATGQVLLPWNR